MATSKGGSDENSRAAGILSAEYRWATIGTIALVVLAAFESLAVTTVMPVISRQLDGASLYAVAFSAPLAAGVVGMVAAGSYSDRHGPRAPLVFSVLLFAVGLVVAGSAHVMPVLVLGRLVYGLASGGVTVGLYVVVARTYPERLQPRIFGGFAAAWILPALVGPAIAGVVADTVGWRWVFYGVVLFVALALAMLAPVLRRVGSRQVVDAAPGTVNRVIHSILLAGAVLALSLGGELPDVWVVIVCIVSLLVVALAVRPLVPTGTLVFRRGIGGVIAVRGTIAAAYFGAEVYLPYLLTGEFHLTPALAGLSLTGAGITWGIASTVQGRLADSFPVAVSMTLGATTVIIATLSAFATALFHLSPVVAIVGWAIGGIGMGMVYPRLSVLTLAYSTPANQGVNSSGLSIADAVGPSISLAVLGIVFEHVAATVSAPAAFATVLALASLLGIVALATSARISERPGESTVHPHVGA